MCSPPQSAIARAHAHVGTVLVLTMAMPQEPGQRIDAVAREAARAVEDGQVPSTAQAYVRGRVACSCRLIRHRLDACHVCAGLVESVDLNEVRAGAGALTVGVAFVDLCAYC
jgi:hypothetical protein